MLFSSASVQFTTPFESVVNHVEGAEARVSAKLYRHYAGPHLESRGADLEVNLYMSCPFLPSGEPRGWRRGVRGQHLQALRRRDQDLRVVGGRASNHRRPVTCPFIQRATWRNFVTLVVVQLSGGPRFRPGLLVTATFPANADMDTVAIDYSDPEKTHIEVALRVGDFVTL